MLVADHVAAALGPTEVDECASRRILDLHASTSHGPNVATADVPVVDEGDDRRAERQRVYAVAAAATEALHYKNAVYRRTVV